MNFAQPARNGFAVATIALGLALPAGAQGQAPQRFTAERVLKFEAGTPKARAMLSHTPEVRDLVAEPFGIAAADLNDDGAAEIVLVSRSSSFCGSGGCALVVLEKQGPGKIVPVLSPYVQGEDLATPTSRSAARAPAPRCGAGTGATMRSTRSAADRPWPGQPANVYLRAPWTIEGEPLKPEAPRALAGAPMRRGR